MEDLDVDDMLEAAYKGDSKSPDGGGSGKGSAEKKRSTKSRSKSKDKNSNARSKSPRKRKSRSPDKTRDKRRSSHERRTRSRDRGERDRRSDRFRDRDYDRRGGGRFGGGDRWGGGRDYGRDRYHDRRRSPPRYDRGPPPPRRAPGPERRDVMPFTPRGRAPKHAKRIEDMTPEERDARTVFVMQLAARCVPKDLEDFFTSVGQVRDVRIITDSKTKRSKGIAYVEFYDVEAVPLALGLNNQKLLGVPMLVQPTQSEKNRIASATLAASFVQYNNGAPSSGPMKLYVGSLHFNITEDMLKAIFEPFGPIETIQLLKDGETGRSRGYGFITFLKADDAKRAMEQLNGFELAGRAIKVSHVTEHQTVSQSLDNDDMDRAGVDLGTTGRLQLMAKLAEGSGMKLPEQAQQMLQTRTAQAQAAQPPAIATQCFMLSNMFDPSQEIADGWDEDIRDDVIEECNKHGGILHIYVDKGSPQGNVYCKCPSIASAAAAVTSLHGRWFSGKIITANYVPVVNYHELFPDAVQACVPLTSNSIAR